MSWIFYTVYIPVYYELFRKNLVTIKGDGGTDMEPTRTSVNLLHQFLYRESVKPGHQDPLQL